LAQNQKAGNCALKYQGYIAASVWLLDQNHGCPLVSTVSLRLQLNGKHTKNPGIAFTGVVKQAHYQPDFYTAIHQTI
jgi:hypothetical protein